MARLFAVMNTHGARWDAARPLEEQEDWPAHAAFMDALVAEGVVVLGGPLEGTPDVLLIMRAGCAGDPGAPGRWSPGPSVWGPSSRGRTIAARAWPANAARHIGTLDQAARCAAT